MPNKGLEWKVGLFVLIGLTLLGALFLQFSRGTSLFSSTYNLYLTTENVGGLRRQAAVRLAGVQVGSVSAIQLNSSGTNVNVTITLQIYDNYKVHRDARFVIQQSGFLGDVYVAIIPTKNAAPTFPPGSYARAEQPFNLQEVARSASGFIQRIDETARKLDAAISDVRRLVLNQETLTNLSVTVGTMRAASQRALSTVDNINTLVETNGQRVATAVSNVVFFSDQINQFGSALGEVLSTNSTEITAAVKNIESSTAALKKMMDDVQAGQGLAGALLRNEVLATNVDAIAGNLAITTSNLNRLGLWGILWARPPPRTNTAPEHPLVTPRNPFH